MSNIPERKEDQELENADAIKEKMPKFAEWMSDQIADLTQEQRDRATEIAKKAKREGFWMNEDTIFNLHVIHDLSMDKIEEDVLSAVKEALSDEED